MNNFFKTLLPKDLDEGVPAPGMNGTVIKKSSFYLVGILVVLGLLSFLYLKLPTDQNNTSIRGIEQMFWDWSAENQPDIKIKKVKCTEFQVREDYGTRNNGTYTFLSLERDMLNDAEEVLSSQADFRKFVLNEKQKDYEKEYGGEVVLSPLDSIKMLIDKEFIEILSGGVKDSDAAQALVRVASQRSNVDAFMKFLEDIHGYQITYDVIEKGDKKQRATYTFLTPEDPIRLTLFEKAVR